MSEHAAPAASDSLTTHLPGPRQRAFLPQSHRDRFRSIIWSMAWTLLFRLSPLSLIGWRNTLLRIFGAKIDSTAALSPSARIDYPWNLTLGRNVVVCDQVIINCMGAVTIGDNTRISQYAHICAGTHAYREPDMRIEPRPISIGRDVWIAADAFVGPGVRVGDGAVLAARSSAFHELPAGMICVGEPARAVKQRHLAK